MEVGGGRGGVEISEALSGVKSSGETQVSCLAGAGRTPREPILAELRSPVNHC
jgi:hypothetical protein